MDSGRLLDDHLNGLADALGLVVRRGRDAHGHPHLVHALLESLVRVQLASFSALDLRAADAVIFEVSTSAEEGCEPKMRLGGAIGSELASLLALNPAYLAHVLSPQRVVTRVLQHVLPIL